jgi:hypothetical protein
MFAAATLKSGVMKTKQHAPHVVLNGNAPILLLLASNTVNTQTSVEE